MNAWGIGAQAVPVPALSAFSHDHELALLRRVGGVFALVCDQCGGIGPVIGAAEMPRSGWRLADIEQA